MGFIGKVVIFLPHIGVVYVLHLRWMSDWPSLFSLFYSTQYHDSVLSLATSARFQILTFPQFIISLFPQMLYNLCIWNSIFNKLRIILSSPLEQPFVYVISGIYCSFMPNERDNTIYWNNLPTDTYTVMQMKLDLKT